MAIENCVSCKFFEEDAANTGKGFCHRFPPLPTEVDRDYSKDVVFVAKLAHITHADWCGEFKFAGGP